MATNILGKDGNGASRDIRTDQSGNLQSLSDAMGFSGAKRVTGTTEQTPDSGLVFIAIQAESDTVINSVTGNLNLNGASISAEGVRYGRWYSVTLTSGTAILYMGV